MISRVGLKGLSWGDQIRRSGQSRGKVGECVQASVMMDRKWRGRYTVGDKLAKQQIINLSLSKQIFRRLSKPCVSVVGSQSDDFGVGGSSCF